MDMTTEDAPIEVTSSGGPVSLVDEQHLANERQSSSGVRIKTECTASGSDQTFSFAAILTKSFSEDSFSKSHFSSSVSDKTENAPGEDCLSQTMFASESEKPVPIVDSLLNKRQSSSVNTPSKDCVSQTGFASESEKPLSIVNSSNKSQSSSVSIKALPSTTSSSIDISTTEETISLLNDMAKKSKSASGLDRNSSISPCTCTEQFTQPPRKKIKLSGSIKVPVKDLLSGIHTTLCKHDCTFKHSPLMLAVCVPDDHELKDYLENHWKLVTKNIWKSPPYSLDPKSMKNCVTLVHLTVLFGKYNMLKDLLRVHLGCLELHVGSVQNSPIHTVLKHIHCYMPSSSYQEKLLAFQRILHLLAKYNCNILLVRDRPNEDTILHVCAKKIKDLTNKMQSIQSPTLDELTLQGLLNRRLLLEGIFKEVIHILKRLCADGSLHPNQVIELFDCANNAGETMSQILREDESARNNCRALGSTANSLGTEAFCTNYSSESTTESLPMRTTQLVTSTKTENSTEIITLSTNCPSIQVVTGCLNQSSSTIESASLWPVQTVENSVETTILSTECQFAQVPNGCPKQSSSTTQSASLSPAQTVEANQAENPIKTTILSIECQSVLRPNGCSKKSPSTTASAPLSPGQTVMANEAKNATETTILSTECQSVQMPNGCPKQSSSTTQSASLSPAQTVEANQAENPIKTTILSTECHSVQTPSGCPKPSSSTTASASLSPVQTIVANQGENSTETTILSTECQSAQVPNVCPKPSSSTTASASLSPVQTIMANQAENTTETTILSTECQSAQVPNGCPKPSSSTTASASLSPVQTIVANQAENPTETTILSTECQSAQVLNGCPKPSSSTTASASLSPVQTIVANQAENPTETTILSTECQSAQVPNGCPKPSSSTTASASLSPVQTIVANQAENPTETTILSTECQSAQVLNGCPKPSSSTTASASLSPVQTIVANQAENSAETTILSTECQSAQVPNGCMNLSSSTTQSASLSPVQTIMANRADFSTETTILSTECQSVQMLNGCTKPSSSTTQSASLLPVQTVMASRAENSTETTTTLLTDCSSSQTPSGCQKQSTSTVSAASDLGPSKTVDTAQAQVTWTMPVNTVRQPSGKHTFLCRPDCTLKHLKLVELLCATPDHLSMDRESVEAESCANLRDYLKKSCWDISKVVPALEPSLRLPIAHLACFLGKHKALEVLSEFHLHPLLRTAKTMETPLHMTVQLLQHQPSNNIFLSDVIVSIVKTLNQHSHPISLFSAKDTKGNSVLHAMAELISSTVPEAATLLYVYLFRVFVNFILKEQRCIPKSASLQILSGCLMDCNKAGQNVKSLLQKSIHGVHLLEYLNGLMQKGRPEMSSETVVETRKDSCGLQKGQNVTCTVQKHTGTQRNVQGMSKEPKSLVDFILSADCKISSASKKKIVDCYIGEHERRMQLVQAKMALVREEMRMMESDVRLHARRRTLREGELKEKRREQVLLHNRLQILEGLKRTVNER